MISSSRPAYRFKNVRSPPGASLDLGSAGVGTVAADPSTLVIGVDTSRLFNIVCCRVRRPYDEPVYTGAPPPSAVPAVVVGRFASYRTVSALPPCPRRPIIRPPAVSIVHSYRRRVSANNAVRCLRIPERCRPDASSPIICAYRVLLVVARPPALGSAIPTDVSRPLHGPTVNRHQHPISINCLSVPSTTIDDV